MKKGKIVLTGLAVLVLLLVIVNILLMAGNQSLQLSVNERQQYIAETIQLEALNRQVIGVLAEMALPMAKTPKPTRPATPNVNSQAPRCVSSSNHTLSRRRYVPGSSGPK